MAKFKTTRETKIGSMPGVTIPAFSVIDTNAGPFKNLSPDRRKALEEDCSRLVAEAVFVPEDSAQRKAAQRRAVMGPPRNSGTLG